MSTIFYLSKDIKTPLGSMTALACDKALHVLDFHNRKNIEARLPSFSNREKITLKEGSNSIIESIKKELKNYFAGNLKNFTTPIQFDGTTFQRCVWQALLEIPFGEVRNYSEQAHRIKKPQAFRAVANANGKNFLSIIVPCHRVINKNGNLGGYGGGIERKAWLLNHEKNY